jgi:hypothetical protein
VSEILESAFRFRWCLIALTLLALVARMQSITTTMYSIDGYGSDTTSGLYPAIMANGRWGLAALLRLREKLGYFGMNVAPSSLIASTLLFTGAGFLYARVLSPKLSSVELFIFVALFTLHPFVTEFYTFSDATLDIAIAIFLAAAGFTCASATARPRLGMVVGCLLMVIALSIYQTAIAHLAIVGLLGVTGWGLQLEPAPAGPLRMRNVLTTTHFRALSMAAMSAVLYLVSMRLVPRVFQIALDDRTKLSWPPDLADKAHALEKAFRMAFLPLPGFTTPVAAFLLAGVLIVAAAAIVLSILRRRGVGMALAIVALLAAAALCAVVVPISIKEIWLVPRVLSPVSIFIAGVALIGWRCAQLAWIRHVLMIAMVPLWIAYIGTSNRILYDQRRVNLWDAQEANRILARLDADPHFDAMRALALVNGQWGRSQALSTMRGDMNVSALSVSWSKFGLMTQATGDRFEDASNEQQLAAEKYCATAEAWPAAASVTITGDLGVVCLPRED